MATGPNSSVTKLTLNGEYKPSDYFEGPETVEQPGHTISLANGKAEVTLKSTEPEPTVEEQKSIIREVESLLKGRRVLVGRPYEFSGLDFRRHHSDGRREVFVSSQTNIVVMASMVACGVGVSQGPNGVVVRDIRAERMAAEKTFLENCHKHRDNAVLDKLTASFGRAVDDPKDFLVHLYEIRDALAKEFGDEHTTRQNLGITKQEWSGLGKISNDEPVQEGRHRGKHTGLRPATEDERNQAMAIARTMIERYVAFLDSKPPEMP